MTARTVRRFDDVTGGEALKAGYLPPPGNVNYIIAISACYLESVVDFVASDARCPLVPRTNVPPERLFGLNVRRLRLAAGISQDELSARAGLHRTYLSSLENGNRNVSLQNIFAIAGALNCRPGELLEDIKDD